MKCCKSYELDISAPDTADETQKKVHERIIMVKKYTAISITKTLTSLVLLQPARSWPKAKKLA